MKNRIATHLHAALAHLDRLTADPEDVVSFRSLKAHLFAASRAADVMGPSSGTVTEDQPSMTGGKGAGLDDGMNDINLSPRQPGGSRTDPLERKGSPGGSDGTSIDLDDGDGTPDGVHPDHHKVLDSFDYEHVGEGDYTHPDGGGARSVMDADGTPRTTVGTNEFSDADDLREHLNQVHGIADPQDDSTSQKFAAAHGHSPEAHDHARQQLAAFRSYKRSNPTSELTFESWLRFNGLPRGGRAF